MGYYDALWYKIKVPLGTIIIIISSIMCTMIIIPILVVTMVIVPFATIVLVSQPYCQSIVFAAGCLGNPH